MSNHLMTDLILGDGNTDQETHAAMLACAYYGRDVPERHSFLQALGFIPTTPAHPEARDDTGRMKPRRSR